VKIGFIPLSGIRVADRELLRLGLTLPGFVERSQTIASLPSLGLLTLAGATPAGHDLGYYEAPDPAAWDDIPGDLDLAALSTFSAQVNEAYALADRLRAQGTLVVMGGPHVSVLPDEALAHCDAVVLGEGEAVWDEVVRDAAAGLLAPRYGRRGVPVDLATTPMPRYDLLDPDRYNRITVQTSRGCPHRCSFCAATPVMGPGYRNKPVDRVLAEIDAVRAIWPKPFIEFADDNSFVDKRWWKEFLPRLAERRLHWFTECDLAVADDEELLALMADAGCAQVLIGLESPVSDGLDRLELRGNWKLKRQQKYQDAILRIQSHGISVNGCFILGLDGHDAGIFQRVSDFVDDSCLAEVQVTVLTAFPGTPLYTDMERAGRLLHPGDWGRCTLFDVGVQPLGMSLDELQDGFRRLVVDLYSDERTAARRESFRRQRRRGRRRMPPRATGPVPESAAIRAS
jgi:radical SAM superfamily enzyme YgiQ (UPF0313 family)